MKNVYEIFRMDESRALHSTMLLYSNPKKARKVIDNLSVKNSLIHYIVVKIPVR